MPFKGTFKGTLSFGFIFPQFFNVAIFPNYCCPCRSCCCSGNIYLSTSVDTVVTWDPQPGQKLLVGTEPSGAICTKSFVLSLLFLSSIHFTLLISQLESAATLLCCWINYSMKEAWIVSVTSRWYKYSFD